MGMQADLMGKVKSIDSQTIRTTASDNAPTAHFQLMFILLFHSFCLFM
ncbi:hypothetical protein J2T15_004742 [Paenibacillus harenae]|uniref:Uncharacterized protein n=1 Tax=Paenibacillus harenae TaxID=306543 RepID=A0ABT9UAR4_PAEHA|nr:hypothetical protein [Paenibacillus harenae]